MKPDVTQRTCPNCTATGSGKFCTQCGAPLGAGSCPQCGAPLSPAARFCHACGTPSAAGRPRKRTSALPWLIAGSVAALAVVVLAARGARMGPAEGPRETGARRSVPAPDLSGMSPREQADRLFDVVMTAVQRGDTAQVGFHAPMALAAYANLDSLDGDAHYHVGLLLVAAGDLAGAAAMADTLEAHAPGHLLAATLRHSVARQRGDSAAMLRAYRQFVENHEREIALRRPEYLAHQRAIDAFLADALRAAGGGE